jgi:hexulose-6-phosphate isomerase
MLKGINGWSFGNDMSWAEIAACAKKAGFQALEPTIGMEGELSVHSKEANVRKIAEHMHQCGLEIPSLATSLHWTYSFTDPDPEVRSKARELTVACLERAFWLGAKNLLVVPGVVRHFREDQLRTPYEEALNYAYRAFYELMGETERVGVSLALENVWNAFLVSPVEMREMIDRINSAWIGCYFDVGNVLRYGMPEDWIRTLGQRIVGVHAKDFQRAEGTEKGFCLPGDGDANWPAIMAALQRVGYDGPVVFEGPGEPAEISKRMDEVLLSSEKVD